MMTRHGECGQNFRSPGRGSAKSEQKCHSSRALCDRALAPHLEHSNHSGEEDNSRNTGQNVPQHRYETPRENRITSVRNLPAKSSG